MMKDQLSRIVPGRRAALGAMALAAVVVAAACSSSTLGGPSLTADVVSSSAVTVVEGNCSIAGASKDESAPFSLPGVNELYIKAGNNCFGPINAGNVGDSNLACFNIAFSAAGVSVSGVGGRNCRGFGLSHIEGLVVEEPPCEIDPKTGQCKEEEPPK